ncbi:hypothetical protein AL524_24415 [Citrobacter amalonaticus]|nr:hypothetical protein AL524_24415 [Citrobacter amalonaticus]
MGQISAAIRQRKKCLMALRLSDLPFVEICRPDKAFTPLSAQYRYERLYNGNQITSRKPPSGLSSAFTQPRCC